MTPYTTMQRIKAFIRQSSDPMATLEHVVDIGLREVDNKLTETNEVIQHGEAGWAEKERNREAMENEYGSVKK